MHCICGAVSAVVGGIRIFSVICSFVRRYHLVLLFIIPPASNNTSSAGVLDVFRLYDHNVRRTSYASWCSTSSIARRPRSDRSVQSLRWPASPIINTLQLRCATDKDTICRQFIHRRRSRRLELIASPHQELIWCYTGHIGLVVTCPTAVCTSVTSVVI